MQAIQEAASEAETEVPLESDGSAMPLKLSLIHREQLGKAYKYKYVLQVTLKAVAQAG
jgi:hypothetical protein